MKNRIVIITARRVLIMAGVLVLAAGGWMVTAKLLPPSDQHFMVLPVGRGDVQETVLATGIVKPSRLIAIGAQVSGRLTSLKAGVGDHVKSGDLIAEIDSQPQYYSLRTAQAALDNVKAQRIEKQAALDYAQASLARQQATWEKNASSRADLDAADEAVKTARAQIAELDAQIVSAEVAVDTAKVNLAYTRITTPIDGTVLAVVTQEGQTVNSTQSAPTIVILGQIDVMTVRAQISEADIVKVKAGQPIYFTIVGDPDHRYQAKLEAIEPAPDSIRTDTAVSSSSTSTTSSSSSSTSSAIYYNGIFSVPNTDGRLKTYMTAEVHVVVGEVRDVVTVPATVLTHKGPDGRYGVMVAGADQHPQLRRVEIGLNNKVVAQVLSGLEVGDKVLVEPAAAGQKSPQPFPGGPPGGGPGGPPPMGF
jgi:macrolide-specific efflux system membrane fusion protein